MHKSSELSKIEKNKSPAGLRILIEIRLGVAGSVKDIIRFKYDTVNYIEIIYLR